LEKDLSNMHGKFRGEMVDSAGKATNADAIPGFWISSRQSVNAESPSISLCGSSSRRNSTLLLSMRQDIAISSKT